MSPSGDPKLISIQVWMPAKFICQTNYKILVGCVEKKKDSFIEIKLPKKSLRVIVSQLHGNEDKSPSRLSGIITVKIYQSSLASEKAIIDFLYQHCTPQDNSMFSFKN